MALDSATRAEALVSRLDADWSADSLQQLHDAHVSAGDSTIACALLRHYALAERPEAAQAATALAGAPHAILDALWAIDQELEARRDIGAAQGATDGDVALGGEPVILDTARARLAHVLATLLDNGTVDRAQVCTLEDASLLGALGIVDAAVFSRRGVQIRTANFFKQQKYNLLREDNEGYAALITEIFTQMGAPLRTEQGRVVEQEDASERDARACRLVDRMLVLTGTFSLDANRVLDVLLDVFSAHVTHHHPFFRALLRAASAPWDGALIARLLGFKFEYYAQPNALDSAPEELYLVAALLIRDGTILPGDIYPYLAPGVDLSSLRKEYYEALSERNASGGANALAMAAPLGDDDNAAPEAPPAESAAPKPPAQLPELLRVLLGVGAVELVLPFVTRAPWLFGAFPGLTAAFVRIIEYQAEPALRRAAPQLAATFSPTDEALTPLSLIHI